MELLVGSNTKTVLFI